MRKKLYMSLLICTGIVARIAAEDCSCQATSKTFFTTRMQFQVASPELLSSWRGQQGLDDDECSRSTFQALVFGGKSTQATKLGRYFMPFCSATAATTSVDAPTNNQLFVQNFNIASVQFSSPAINALFPTPGLVDPFSSIVSVKPQQSIVALGLTYQYNFCWHSMPYWLRINAPIMHVRNSMNLCESVLTTSVYSLAPVPGTNLVDQQPNMQSALSQCQWLYGKIDNKIHAQTKLAFIQIQCGELVLDSDCYYFSPYLGVTIPTGTTPKGEYVFEPVAGNGNHWGLFWGFTSEMLFGDIWFDAFEFGGAIDLNMEYLFKKTQRRSFDLKNSPWSRYNELYANAAQANEVRADFLAGTLSQLQAIFIATPGINLLTQKVSVNPGFNLTANLALTLVQKCSTGFNGEVGYNFYAKQAECLSLACKNFNADQAALKDQVGTGFANQIRTITENTLTNEATTANLIINGQLNTAGAMASYQRSIIQPSDLDLSSAAHPATLSNIVYGVVGYHWDSCSNPMAVSLGASYEFSLATNTTLNRWLLWGRWGISF